jgi:hypothetical protein
MFCENRDVFWLVELFATLSMDSRPESKSTLFDSIPILDF